MSVRPALGNVRNLVLPPGIRQTRFGLHSAHSCSLSSWGARAARGFLSFIVLVCASCSPEPSAYRPLQGDSKVSGWNAAVFFGCVRFDFMTHLSSFRLRPRVEEGSVGLTDVTRGSYLPGVGWLLRKSGDVSRGRGASGRRSVVSESPVTGGARAILVGIAG